MPGFPANHFCKRCDKETLHSEQLIRKTSSYDRDHSVLGRLKLLANTFINGGHYYNMDRYVKCNECGHRELNNWGNEFE